MNESLAMQELPPYLFARIERKIAECREQGIDVINLGIGDPDLPTPAILLTVWPKAFMMPPIINTPVQRVCSSTVKP